MDFQNNAVMDFQNNATGIDHYDEDRMRKRRFIFEEEANIPYEWTESFERELEFGFEDSTSIIKKPNSFWIYV